MNAHFVGLCCVFDHERINSMIKVRLLRLNVTLRGKKRNYRCEVSATMQKGLYFYETSLKRSDY